VNADALAPLQDTLQRDAGWPDRGRSSVTVRADAQILAIDARAGPSSQLQPYDIRIAGLPSGELRERLRTAAGQMRHVLAEPS